MAWGAGTLIGSTGNASANNTSVTATLNRVAGSAADLNDILVVTVGVNNFSSVSNADEGAVTSVTDNGTNSRNVWVKAREVTGNAGTPASTTGTVCSVWYTRVHTALTTANTVTANFSNSAARDGATMLVNRFTVSGSAQVKDSTYLTQTSSAFGSIDQTETATEFLRFRAIAARTTVTSMTTTSGWTSLGTTRASATVNQAIFGEFLITSASTAASSPKISASVVNANIYAVFEEYTPLGQVAL